MFRRLERELSQRGYRCFAPSLTPSDARHGLADLAEKLAAFVDGAVEADEQIAIVGFSMGCLISRYYLQRLEGFRRATAFFAISGPHGGTAWAYLYPGRGARQMRPGSDLLQVLDATSGCLEGMPLVAYWTPLDFTIVPATSARWPVATDVRIPSLLHRLMASDGRVCDDIARRLDEIGQAAPEAPLGL